jgi:hypothetical protein
MAASLFVILARNGSDAVIFRRGPSKQVLLIKWDRRTDSFEIGQWFKGRIYEHRCDLSPSGNLLVYLAAKHKGPIGTWNAVSRPPYLTALALWPNLGTWGGGGLFESESTLLLHHDAPKLAEGFRLPARMVVRSLGDGIGVNEYDGIHHARLLRDGWTLRQKGELKKYRTERDLKWRFEPVRLYEKTMPRKKVTRIIQLQLRGISGEGTWYKVDHALLDHHHESLLALPGTSWADWDSNGDLLFAEGGKLFRLPWSNRNELGRDAAKEIADFSALTFAPKEPPKEPWDPLGPKFSW